MTQDLQIYSDTVELSKTVLELTSNFPRKYKFFLGDELGKTALALLRLIHLANKCRDTRTEKLCEFIATFDYFKDLLRLSEETKCISTAQQANLAILIDSIGKQSNGWRKQSMREP